MPNSRVTETGSFQSESPTCLAYETIIYPKRGKTNRDDFVFIFGYPGTTYRHRSAAFLRYLSEQYMPAVVDWYGWQIENLVASAQGDRGRELALAARVKGLQNTYKYYLQQDKN